ncbi:MAG: hypothetical protein Pg6A_04160 [Termitinemataceae bacterium]|nr:MAG: hypothetical protein Pg6A_04160 [Termitinemataceae bacterium]
MKQVARAARGRWWPEAAAARSAALSPNPSALRFRRADGSAGKARSAFPAAFVRRSLRKRYALLQAAGGWPPEAAADAAFSPAAACARAGRGTADPGAAAPLRGAPQARGGGHGWRNRVAVSPAAGGGRLWRPRFARLCVRPPKAGGSPRAIFSITAFPDWALWRSPRCPHSSQDRLERRPSK